MSGGKVLERKVFYAGDKIFREGDTGSVAYVVQAGLVEISKTSGGKELVLGTVTDGGIFGEMALIDDEPRMATARAAKQTTVVIIPRDTFKRKLTKCDPFVRGLLGIFVRNIRALTNARAQEVASGGQAPAASAKAKALTDDDAPMVD